MSDVLILGGYGNFGSRIAASLIQDGIGVIISGRRIEHAYKCQENLSQRYPLRKSLIEVVAFDAQDQAALASLLTKLRPKIVINTIGPFQKANYDIVSTCISQGIHYIDLADARDFVVGISQFDERAKANNVLAVSGASTVPGLSSAVIEYYQDQFESIDSLRYGISPGQKAPRGLATTESILTYLGKPLKPWPGQTKKHFGWQNIYRQHYPEIGYRWMANCEIPDLDLFPARYHIKDIQFSAGMESTPLHLGMWLVSYLVRLGFPLNLQQHAQSLLSLSHVFDFLGSDVGGMHMIMRGKRKNGKHLEIQWYIIAEKSDGPQIPCVPAIVLSKKLLRQQLQLRGAVACVGLISLAEYMQALQGFAIRTINKILEI